MNRIVRDELKSAFEAPAPRRKREFVRSLKQPRMSIPAFLISQAGYVRKRVWGIDAAVFAISWTGAVIFSRDMLWGISALTPLLALAVLSESGRSQMYEMAELEMATRFSLRSVVFARLGILGTVNLLFLGLLLPFGVWNDPSGPVMAGIYILTPFLLTSFVGLYIVCRFRGQEAVYLCAGAAALVSFSILFFRSVCPQMYQGDHFVWWILGALAFGTGTAEQCWKMVKGTEELAWN